MDNRYKMYSVQSMDGWMDSPHLCTGAVLYACVAEARVLYGVVCGVYRIHTLW